MAITNKATLLRIKKMIEVGGSCPWANLPWLRYDDGHYGPLDGDPKCMSCNKVMGRTKNKILCPCYFLKGSANSHKIALEKIAKAGL